MRYKSKLEIEPFVKDIGLILPPHKALLRPRIDVGQEWYRQSEGLRRIRRCSQMLLDRGRGNPPINRNWNRESESV